MATCWRYESPRLGRPRGYITRSCAEGKDVHRLSLKLVRWPSWTRRLPMVS